MSHVKRVLILAVCCAAIAVVPAAADDLANYLGSVGATGLGDETLSYSGGTTLFDDGNLQFLFTGLTITPTCTDTVTGAVVACNTNYFTEAQASNLTIQGTTAMNGYAGFDITSTIAVSAYDDPNNNNDLIAVAEDINLNYTVSTDNGAATISDAHLDVGGCVTDSPTSGCVTTGNNLPPKFTINENWAGTDDTLQVSLPPPILNDSVSFLPNTYSSLLASKDISLDSGACSGCSVTITSLAQYYSEVVPEPRAYGWILVAGLLGFAMLRRRSVVKA